MQFQIRKHQKNIMFGSKRGVKGDQNFLYQPFDIKKLGLFWTVQEPGGFYPDWTLEPGGAPCLVPPGQQGSCSEQERNLENWQWIKGLKRINGSVWMRHVTQHPPKNQSFISSRQLKIGLILKFRDTVSFSPPAECPLGQKSRIQPCQEETYLKLKIISYLAARVWSV